MSRIAYINGRYRPHGHAMVHIEDRGYQFADGVYEVVGVHCGTLFDEAWHIDRLQHSLAELNIGWPVTPKALGVIVREVMHRNGLKNGFVYIQITRGVAPRDHAFPRRPTASSLVLTARHTAPFELARNLGGVSVVTGNDERWKRCNIKTISLLPNVLAKQNAVDVGAYDTWFVDGDGNITEGTASNAWIVTAAGELRTRSLSADILPGITRRRILGIAREHGLTVNETPFSIDDAGSAVEAFITSTTSFVRPVTQINGKKVGAGEAGPLTRKLLQWYAEFLDDVATNSK